MLSGMQTTVSGVVVEGYRIASGLNREGAITGPNGEVVRDSFVRQRKFFEAEIPEMKSVWTGTINLSIAPKACHMLKWDYEVTCEWQPGTVETFGIVKDVILRARGGMYNGFIYYPLPSPIHSPRHDLIELLAPKIEGLAYGDEVSIDVAADTISIQEKE